MNGDARRDLVPQRGIALRYVIGAVVFGVVSTFSGIWAIVFGWIAVTLAIMACAYLWIGPAVYRKRNGRIPWWIRVLLWPHTLGVWVVRRWQFRRMARPYDVIERGVILGRLLRESEARALIKVHGVTAVLDLCAEHSEAKVFTQLRYENIAVLDMNVPSERLLREAADFIASHSKHGCVYVHCGIGKSRSAAAVAAYLLLGGKAGDADEACELVQQRRPASKFTLALRQAVRALTRTSG